MPKSERRLQRLAVLLFCVAVASYATSLCARPLASTQAIKPLSDDKALLKEYLDKVYRTMDDNYYLPISPEVYQRFLTEYPVERLKEITKKTNISNNFLHIGAGILVQSLKSPSDIHTTFVPPKKTKEFKQKAYAVTEDLGIEGKKSDLGFEITLVHMHADAYLAGIRQGDRILSINGQSTKKLSQEEIVKLLTPVVGTLTKLEIFFKIQNLTKIISLESKSYFKETVFRTPCVIPGVLILKITHFNQKTSEDFASEIDRFGEKNIQKFILDLRGNEGGPPLAAREILGFFTPPNDPLFAIARKKQRPFMLQAPAQPLSLKCPLTILVDRQTGSASEMFSGVLQAKRLAVLVGQKTAGATYLKNIFDFEDGSMIFMVTSLTFFYNRNVFPADGLTPNIYLVDKQDALQFVLQQLR